MRHLAGWRRGPRADATRLGAVRAAGAGGVGPRRTRSQLAPARRNPVPGRHLRLHDPCRAAGSAGPRGRRGADERPQRRLRRRSRPGLPARRRLAQVRRRCAPPALHRTGPRPAGLQRRGRGPRCRPSLLGNGDVRGAPVAGRVDGAPQRIDRSDPRRRAAQRATRRGAGCVDHRGHGEDCRHWNDRRQRGDASSPSARRGGSDRSQRWCAPLAATPGRGPGAGAPTPSVCRGDEQVRSPADPRSPGAWSGRPRAPYGHHRLSPVLRCGRAPAELRTGRDRRSAGVPRDACREDRGRRVRRLPGHRHRRGRRQDRPGRECALGRRRRRRTDAAHASSGRRWLHRGGDPARCPPRTRVHRRGWQLVPLDLHGHGRHREPRRAPHGCRANRLDLRHARGHRRGAHVVRSNTDRAAAG